MLVAQDGKCAICRRRKKLCIDHCHTSDLVRGLLCHGCNVAVGMCETTESFFAGLVSYLEKVEAMRETKTPYSEAVRACVEGGDLSEVAARFKVKPAKLRKGFELAVGKELDTRSEWDSHDCLLAARASTSRVNEAVRWFLSYFCDPTGCCPYDGAEGGFQYLWGGPYTAQDGLEMGFDLDDVEEDDLFKCLEILERHPLNGSWSGPPEDCPAEEVDNNS